MKVDVGGSILLLVQLGSLLLCWCLKQKGKYQIVSRVLLNHNVGVLSFPVGRYKRNSGLVTNRNEFI